MYIVCADTPCFHRSSHNSWGEVIRITSSLILLVDAIDVIMYAAIYSIWIKTN